MFFVNTGSLPDRVGSFIYGAHDRPGSAYACCPLGVGYEGRALEHRRHSDDRCGTCTAWSRPNKPLGRTPLGAPDRERSFPRMGGRQRRVIPSMRRSEDDVGDSRRERSSRSEPEGGGPRRQRSPARRRSDKPTRSADKVSDEQEPTTIRSEGKGSPSEVRDNDPCAARETPVGGMHAKTVVSWTSADTACGSTS